MRIKLNLPEKTLIPLRDGTYFFYSECYNEIQADYLLKILRDILPYLEEVDSDDPATYELFSSLLSDYRHIRVSGSVGGIIR